MNEEELMQRLRQAFLGEARERLDSLTSQLDSLEKDEDPQHRKASLEVAYREVHSLKGAARAVGFSDVEAVCQAAESVLSALKRDAIPLSRDVSGALYRVLSFVERAVQGEIQEESVAGLCRYLESLIHEPVTEVPPRDTTAASASASFPKGSDVDEPTPGSMSGTEVSKPQGSPLGDEDALGHVKDSDANLETAEALEPLSSLPGMQDGKSKDRPFRPPLPAGSMVRVDVRRLDVFLKRAEELISAKLAMVEHLQHLKDLKRRYEHLKKVCSSGSKEFKWLRETAAQTGAGPLPVSRKSLEGLRRFMEETGASLEGLGEDVSRAVASAEETARTLATLVGELMEGAKEVLLQPFSLVLRGFSRMVREIAEQLGKEATLVIEGDDVEVDRRILEELKDPLVHLLRNALDHGLEKPEERQRHGKPSQGTLWLRVVQEEARTVTLTVEDDGRGIDVQTVREVAVRRGLLSREEAEQMSDEAALQLIFRSDVSTSSMVTELSGRGLGMPIVKEKVEGLGGRLRVETQKGQGTRVIVDLPVSLATFRGILIGDAGRLFVVPTHAVEAVVRFGNDDCGCVEGRQTITHGGRVIRLEKLGLVLGLSQGQGQETKDFDHRRTALILKAGEVSAAVEVEAVLGEQEVLIKGLGPQLQKVPHIWGATVLGSGQVVPVLNAVDVVRSVQQWASKTVSRSVVSADGRHGKSPARRRSVLIAEDSVTSRTLLKNILEAAGYAVQTAVDGQEALALLREHTFDAVVSDVEMPRMNGFELTRTIRQEEKLKHVPVVLVTSLDSREHREQGLEAGADAYIVKSAFDQSTLLDVLERFTGLP